MIRRTASTVSLPVAGGRIALAALVLGGALVNLSYPAGLLTFLPYAIVGSLLVVRRPAHVIGWLLLLMAAGFSIVGRPVDVSPAAVADGEAPWLPVLAWLGTMAGIGLFAGMSWLASVFPTGTLQTGRGGHAARAALVLIAAVAVLQALDPQFSRLLPDGTTDVVLNPIGIAPDWPGWSLLDDGSLYLGVLGGLVVCIVGLLVRFRGARGIERQQHKWFLASLAIVAAAVASGFVLALVDPNGAWIWIPALLTFPLPPIAIGIAILRFRLYDIDRIVSRTIAYAVISTTLVAAYVALILVLQGPLGEVTGGDTVAVAASTLFAAGLFQPVRRRTQAVVDQRFNRARRDGDRTLTALGVRLGGAMDLPFVSGAIVQAARQSVEPATASLWLRTNSPRRRVARDRSGLPA